MRVTQIINQIPGSIALLRIGEDRLDEFVYATYSMIRKTLGIRFDLAPDYLDRLATSCRRHFERMYLVAVDRNGLLRGSGTVLRVDRPGGFLDAFYESGFRDEHVGGADQGPVYLLSRLVLDREGLTVEERWNALQLMQGAVLKYCFQDPRATLVGLPDGARMLKLFARAGVHWRILTEALPSPGLEQCLTPRCALSLSDLSGDARARLKLQPAVDQSIGDPAPALAADVGHRAGDNPEPKAARIRRRRR